MTKILFVYPNKEGYPIIPMAISVLSGVLKYYGQIVDLFDITFLMPVHLDHEAKIRSGTAIKVDMEKHWGSVETVNIADAFQKKINEFKPDLIAFTIIENNCGCAKKLFKVAKSVSNAPILVGGLFPTTCPDFFINDENVDLICVGEGEHAIVQLAERLSAGKDISHIANLIVKKGNKVIKNGLAPYYDWCPLIFQDWDLFDPRHLLKPFMGKMYRTGFFELSRGCPYQCSYCNNKLNQKIFKSLGNYTRQKPLGSAFWELQDLKEKYNLELIFFNDENFLTMKKERLEIFCDEYKKRIGLPFFIMTRADSLREEDTLKLLKDAGCVTIGIGVECGNEKFRFSVLNKKIPNTVYKLAFENCRKYGIRTTANIIIGSPFETLENMYESVAFCKELKADSVSLAIFAPYYGTELRDVCIKNGYMEDRYYDDIATINHSIITMPQLSKRTIENMYFKFNRLAFGGLI
jgi:radical SAM superfamily enzyme YgiQ (UPF0313 family)